MAKFEKGKSGNPAGRKKGAINKVAKPIKEQLSEFLTEKIQDLPGIWEKLNARDKAQFLKDLLPFFVAKMQSVQMDLDIDFETLSENDIDRIVELITKKEEKNGFKKSNELV